MQSPTPLQNHTAFVISTVVVAITLLWLAIIVWLIMTTGQVSFGGLMVSAGGLLILTIYPGCWVWGPLLVAGFLPGIWVFQLTYVLLKRLRPAAVVMPNLIGATVTALVAFSAVFIPLFLGFGLAQTSFSREAFLPMFWDLAVLLWVIVPSALVASAFVLVPEDRKWSQQR